MSGDTQAVNKQDFGLSFVKISYLIAILETELCFFHPSTKQPERYRNSPIPPEGTSVQIPSTNKLKFLGVWFCFLKAQESCIVEN